MDPAFTRYAHLTNDEITMLLATMRGTISSGDVTDDDVIALTTEVFVRIAARQEQHGDTTATSDPS